MISYEVLPCVLQHLDWKDRTMASCTCHDWYQAALLASDMSIGKQHVLEWTSVSRPDTAMLSAVTRCSVNCKGSPPEWIHEVPFTHLKITMPFCSNVEIVYTEREFNLVWSNSSVEHLEIFVNMEKSDFEDGKEPMITIDPSKSLDVGQLTFLRVHAKFKDDALSRQDLRETVVRDDDDEFAGAEIWMNWTSWSVKGLRCVDIASHRITLCDDGKLSGGPMEEYEFHGVRVMCLSKWFIVCMGIEYWQIDDWYNLASIGLQHVSQVENAGQQNKMIASNSETIDVLTNRFI